MSNELTVLPPESAAEGLIAKAIEKGVPVETMERLLVMRRELKAEAAKELFDKAMAAFQAECPTIKKTKEVRDKYNKPRYKYAPLEDIVAQVGGLMQKHGLSHSEDSSVEPGWVTGFCQVRHVAGHSETKQFKVPIQADAYMSEPQKFASAFTFCKRYAFCAAFGILTGDEDNDGAQVETNKPPAVKPSTPTKPPPTPSKPQEGAIPAQQKPLQERIDKLKFQLGGKADWAVGYLRNYTVEGSDSNAALLPVETLDDLHETQVEWLSKNWKNFMDRLDQFIEENASSEPANEGSLVDVDNMPPPRAEEAAQQGEQMPDEWFMDIVVPVPRKGQKRDVYLKNPDTIRSLYDVRHDDDEARRRLWGFVEHYEPKGWTKRDGTEMPASEADVKFRLALDAFADWFERNHPDEKL